MPASKAELVVVSGRYKGHRIPLRPEALRIGRDRACDVALDDEAASRIHSEIVMQGDQYILRDLKSTNGTFLNEARITESPLQNGDRIGVGDTVMMLRLEPREDKQTTQVVFSKERVAPPARMSLSLDDTKFLEIREGTSIPDAQRRLSLLYEFMVDIAGVLHMSALLERALEHFFNAFPADRGLILLLTADGAPGLKVTKVRAPQPGDENITISRTMAHQLLQKKESFISMDADSDPRLAGAQSLHDMRVKSIMGSPLKVKDKVTGMMYFDTRASATAFSETDLRLCTAMALQLAVCVENSRLYNELLDATEFNQSILRSLQSGIIVVDVSGRVLRVNHATQAILGKADAVLLGRKLSEVPELAELGRIVETTLTTGTPEDRYEILVKVGDETIPLGLSTSVLSDHTSKIVGVVANFRNLAVIRKLEEQVRRSQHLAALGQMAAGVAHEIRNPLNSIRGFAQLLQEKHGDDKARTEYTQVILEEVDRMNGIVQDLLDFSRQRDLTLNSVLVQEVLPALIRDMQHDAEQAGVTLALDMGHGNWPPLLGNGDKLRQVFRNIILNGIQACAKGGSVAVSVAAVEEAILIKGKTGTIAPMQRKLAIIVKDTGCGIEPGIVQKIFDPFFTQKDTGTGLGLSISQKIVDQHGGRIEVQSQPGQGATFTVFLPAAQQSPADLS
ncbi:MAG TPA: ATP-binding protein [Planctomycetota bacterium]